MVHTCETAAKGDREKSPREGMPSIYLLWGRENNDMFQLWMQSGLQFHSIILQQQEVGQVAHPYELSSPPSQNSSNDTYML